MSPVKGESEWEGYDTRVKCFNMAETQSVGGGALGVIGLRIEVE